jgi:hypothetical protein
MTSSSTTRRSARSASARSRVDRTGNARRRRQSGGSCRCPAAGSVEAAESTGLPYRRGLGGRQRARGRRSLSGDPAQDLMPAALPLPAELPPARLVRSARRAALGQRARRRLHRVLRRPDARALRAGRPESGLDGRRRHCPRNREGPPGGAAFARSLAVVLVALGIGVAFAPANVPGLPQPGDMTMQVQKGMEKPMSATTDRELETQP